MFDEKHHALIVSEYYRLLLERFGERGREAFRQAACTYGEQRGKRMAMRAIADGHALDYEGYFAYGEYPATADYFDVEMWAEDGVVHERVTRCPWAAVFAERGLKKCGVDYCREIDRAIVRGFNPELELETASTQHEEGCCRFYFRDSAVVPSVLEDSDKISGGRTDLIKPLSYHCAHVYKAFAQTVKGVFGAEGEAIANQVASAFAQAYGDEMKQQLLLGAQAAFDTIA